MINQYKFEGSFEGWAKRIFPNAAAVRGGANWPRHR